MLVFVFLLFTGIVIAQDDQEFEDAPLTRLVIPEIGLSLSYPSGVFDSRQTRNGFGFEGGVHFQMDPLKPFTLGLNVNYNYYGGFNEEFIDFFDGISINVDERVSSHIITILPSARYYLPLDFRDIKVYTEFSFGAKILYTTLSLEDTDGGDAISEFEFVQSDLSLSYGVGLGVNIPLVDYIFFNGRVAYNPGVSAEYYARGDVPRNNTSSLDAFELHKTSTNVISLTLGVSLFL